jgi:hypothetical protein
VRPDDARCTREMKPGIAIAKAAFKNKKTLFTGKLNSNLRKKLVFVWC